MTQDARYDHRTTVEGVQSYFDAFAEQEWHRLDSDPPGRVSFEVHRRFLARYVRPGMRILEIGAGPGRFTMPLAELGARVVATDISPVQVALNAQYVAAAGCDGAVESRDVVDVCDLSRYADAEFDAAVAYGGPLSYAFDAAGTALEGLFRVVRSGGPVIASVMSTLGAYRHFLPGVLDLGDLLGDEVAFDVLRSGDLRVDGMPGHDKHSCRLFRASGVIDLAAVAGGRVLAMSSSHCASLGDPAAVARMASDPQRWQRFLDLEVEACAEPGAIDGGLHILFAAQRG